MADHFEYYHIESVVAAILATGMTPPAPDAGAMLKRYREMLKQLRQTGGLGQPDIKAGY